MVPDPLIQANALTKVHLGSQIQESQSAKAVAIDFPFWSQVFHTIAKLIALSHEYDRYWHLIHITGYELNDFGVIDISSLSYTNPPVKSMIDSGLVNVNIDQSFNNMVGTIDRSSIKSFDQLE